MKITLGTVNYNDTIFNTYIGTSIPKCKFDQVIIEKQNGVNPCLAKMYNSIIKKSKNNYILFLHPDVSFNQQFLSEVENSINLHPDFGAMGNVGIQLNNKKVKSYKYSNPVQQYDMETLDSCCILINKNNRLTFDEKNFNGLHLCVEDYCCQARSIGLKIWTILGNRILHHSVTLHKKGGHWGEYDKYKKILCLKWKRGVKTT